MDLQQMIDGLDVGRVIGTLDKQVGRPHFDSRDISSGDVFVAVPGTQVDGHKFIPAALKNGATVVVCEHLPEEHNPTVTYIVTASSRRAIALLACNYFGHPSRGLRLVGVTGTNGKTTTASLVHQVFTRCGYRCGLLSTIRNLVGNEEIPSTHTTGDPVQLGALLARMRDEGCTHCFMEVSSHALHQDRVTGLDFDVAVFTNLTRDHLDYHGDLAAYSESKSRLFSMLREDAYALINTDDAYAASMVSSSRAQIKTYSLESAGSDYRCDVLSSSIEGLEIEINGVRLHSSLRGRFNASNLTAALAVAELLGVPLAESGQHTASLSPPDGRFETLRADDGALVVVDFAHTPDGVESILTALSEMKYEAHIVTVIGCGGERDKGKRPEMAAVACKYSDSVVFTSDNPRSENPEDIIADMCLGVPSGYTSFYTVPDRKDAIALARTISSPGDLVLIAGKGHEKYQQIGSETIPFDDVHEAKGAFGIGTEA